MIKKVLILFLLFSACLIGEAGVFAQDARITVNLLLEEGEVNTKIFGINLLGFDPAEYKKNKKNYYGYSDYGAGIWDPEKGAPVEELVQLAKEAGVAVLRFPGGCGSHNYEWKKAIGSVREHNLFGIDEFMTVTKAIGAEPVITIGFFAGNEQDAADLVEYLNSPDDGTHAWAKKRSKNGRKDPYGVQYFEFGNETWHGNHDKPLVIPSPEEYARRYLSYVEKMKTVDPNIKIGAVLLNIGYKNKDWDKTVIDMIGDKADYFITHDYPPHFSNKKLYEKVGLKRLFEISLAYPAIDDQLEFDRIAALINKASPANTIGIFVSEFNAYFVQDKPLPYRHSLGAALINAELIKFFMVSKNNIQMAAYWNFCNEYWGMVANGFKGDPLTLYSPYYRRPNYFVFKTYHDHFGDILLDSSVQCETYEALKQRIPYLSVSASVDRDRKKVYLMVINKNMEASIRALIYFKGFTIKSQEGKAWILNGPAIDSTNEEKHDTVNVAYEDFKMDGHPFEYEFQPHSLTAIEISRS